MDREDVLWKAEKLVRQGRLNLAITEYKRVVDEYPEDWSTANTLGDLYLRAQQADKAVEQYLRIADHLAQEGFLPKAAALYKKALKIKPSDEHALLQAAEIALRQSLLAEARQFFMQAVAARRASGQLAGAAEVLMRVAALDPEDLQTRMAAARAVAEAGQGEVAAGEFVALADELEARGHTPECLQALEEAGRLAPGDAAIRSRVTRGLAEHGAPERARQYARSADDFRELVNVFTASGDDEGARECLREVVRLDPADAGAAARLVQAYVRRGDLFGAQPYLATAGETGEPAQLMLVGEVMVRIGQIEDGRVIFTRLLARAPHCADDVVALGVALVRDTPAAALACIESAASIHLLRGDFAAAAAAYERLLAAHPSNLTALMCLVELCVEGGLEDQLVSAQGRLVDAYLEHGQAIEARAVAEDLASRTNDPAHAERLRRARAATGEPEAEPEPVLADRLGVSEPAADTVRAVAPGNDSFADELEVDLTAAEGAPSAPASFLPELPPTGEGSDPFRLGPGAIDLRSILGEALDAEPGSASGVSGREDDVTDREKGAGTKGNEGANEDPFASFHDEVSREADAALAEQHYKVGLTYRDMGMLSEAIGELELAVRSPRLRFEAAALLARLSIQRGAIAEAIEWFERAAEAPAPSADAARGLLYELGDTLENGGESARALAVFLELRSEAGDYRDVSRRIERLSKVQTGG